MSLLVIFFSRWNLIQALTQDTKIQIAAIRTC